MTNKNKNFITFEGIDGSGKSTILQKVAQLLVSENKDLKIKVTREPGGSIIAEQIREILLSPKNHMSRKTELLLLIASRVEHLNTEIIPALQNNKIVICDRYIHSSIAYQGYGRGIDINEIISINKWATNNLLPGLVIFFDLNPTDAYKRTNRRKELNRLDVTNIEFKNKVYNGYKQILEKQFLSKIVSVNASDSINVVCENVKQIIVDYLKNKG